MNMKRLALVLIACTSITALSAGAAFASWGGGTGDDAVEVVGTISQTDTKYYITGTLRALSDTPSQRVLDAEGQGTWQLDFGRQDYYLPDGFEDYVGDGQDHTIQGKLCEGGEIDVYVVDGTDVGRPEGGRPAGFPPPGWHPRGGPPGHDGHPLGGPPGLSGLSQGSSSSHDGHPQGDPPGLTDHPQGGPPGLADHPLGGPPGLTGDHPQGGPPGQA